MKKQRKEEEKTEIDYTNGLVISPEPQILL
jgi:hypothetical protein